MRVVIDDICDNKEAFSFILYVFDRRGEKFRYKNASLSERSINGTIFFACVLCCCASFL